MNKTETKMFYDILGEIPDYRRGNAIRHKLNEILSITILGILCNANTLTGLERFGKTHEAELRGFFELPYGIPSHDTFGDVLGRIDYAAVEQLFRKWLTKMRGGMEPVSIAIDGKTIRRSAGPLQKAAHVVTAYSSDLQLVLGQVLTDEKSNEITAIPEILDTLDIKGATVTIDAMGTQTAIAEKIIDQGADYILGLKENQPVLLEDARFYFEQDYSKVSRKALTEAGCYARTVEKGHGRIETRECWLIKDSIASFRRADVWKKLSGIAVIRSTRSVTGGPTSETYRYYLFSHESLTAKEFLTLQRQHWAVENNLHWVLDVVFREDDLHARVEHIAIVMNLLRKLVLQMLKHDTTLSGSMAGKREICAWRFDLALNLLRNAHVS